MAVNLLSRTKQKAFQINQSEKNTTYVTYLDWKIKNSFLGYTKDLISQILKKNIFALIIFAPLAFTATEISVALTFNLDFWDIEKQ